MKIVCKLTKDEGTVPDGINLYPVGDLHYGNPRQNRDKLKRLVDTIGNDPNGYWMCLGDVMELAHKRTRGSEVFETVMTPDQQFDAFVEDFRDIAPYCVGLIEGNHDARMTKEFGMSPVRLAAKQMQIEHAYVHDGAIVFLNFRKEKSKEKNVLYSIYATHGTGSAATVGNQAASLEAAGEAVISDVVLGAHSHTPIAFRDLLFVPQFTDDFENPTYIERHYVLTGSFVDHGGYTVTSRMKARPTGCPVIWFNPDHKEIKVTL